MSYRPKIRMLCLDGGGIRGIIPAMVLDALEKKLQRLSGNPNARIADYFDFIAGTSTGGIITCALLHPYVAGPGPAGPGSEEPGPAGLNGTAHPTTRYSAEAIVDLYVKNGATIFERSGGSSLLRIVAPDMVDALTDERYKAGGIERVLNRYFGKLTLDRLVKPCLVTSYDTVQRRTVFFSKQKAEQEGDDRNFYVRDVCRATSAAPTYFEAARIESLGGVEFSLIDGGIFANNPTLCAYAEVRKAALDPTVQDMYILSLGTGSVRTPYYFNDIKDKPSLFMIPALIDMMMSGVAETTHYQVGKMFEARNVPDQYVRIDAPNLTDKEAEMDNASEENIQLLKSIGFQTAQNADLDKVARALLAMGDENRRHQLLDPLTFRPDPLVADN